VVKEDHNPNSKKMKVEDALAIIRDKSQGVLKVEDLLGLFPPEAKVEEMKKHLCSCLEDYEQKIARLRTQIQQHSDNAERLRTEKRNQRNKHITISPGQACDLCFISVFEREFYVFPCGHAFHRDCVFDFLCNDSYGPKDPKVGMMRDKAKSKLSEIN